MTTIAAIAATIRRILTAARTRTGNSQFYGGHGALTAAPACYPPTSPPAAVPPVLSRPRAAASTRLTRALIIGAYNRAGAPARAVLAASGWRAEGYGPCAG